MHNAQQSEPRENRPENETMETPRQTGAVKWFDDQKKYGFIRRENGSDVFVHFSNINREPPRLQENDLVEFTVLPGKEGPEAHNVVVLTEAVE